MFRSPKLSSSRARLMMRNCCFATLVILASLHQGFAQSNVVVIRPKEIHDVLVNPGMGITTFQRFNGQEPNAPLKWSEVGPVTKLGQAPTKPDFPEASISYCRWYWNVLETEPGKFHWEIVDLALEEARTHGQSLAIRLIVSLGDCGSRIGGGQNAWTKSCYSSDAIFQPGSAPGLVSELGRAACQQTDRQGRRNLAAGFYRSVISQVLG